MTVQLELWQLISLLLAFFGAVWTFGRMLIAQNAKHLDERFMVQEKTRGEAQAVWDRRFVRIEEALQDRERDHSRLLSELPLLYFRREDHIRFETAVLGKMDALNAKLDLMNERRQVTRD